MTTEQVRVQSWCQLALVIKLSLKLFNGSKTQGLRAYPQWKGDDLHCHNTYKQQVLWEATMPKNFNDSEKVIFETQIFFCCKNTSELFEWKLKTVPYQGSPGNKISANITDLWGFFSLRAPAFKVPLCVPMKARPRNCFVTGKKPHCS